ncbi:MULTISPECIES: hypothetical protein [unclassified Colwellia]|jgi:hypothetical protein|uniref:hypothetical protein n=1 Tax=unclassified Colwellia TaxID=196834 RepID=UPI0015F583E1|nr:MULTISPECIES: hypothetical protein [unclassified Colwellia]MBA6256434.1 hypothetical protein [Colwellia sp. MB3u-28]MBA6260363.1 hypothetical protein [Colwellia sp. MB3u-41]
MKHGISIGFIISLISLPNYAADSDAVSLGNALNSVGQAKVDNITSGSGSSFELTAGEKDKRVSLKWGISSPQSVFTTVFSVPADSDGNTDLANLDGLAKYNKVTLNYKRTLFAKPTVSLIDLKTSCEKIQNELNLKTDEGCALNDLIAKYDDNPEVLKQLLEINSKAWGKTPTIFWGGTATYGSKKMDYLDENTFKKNDETKYGWSISGYIGLFETLDSVWALELKREESYKDADNDIKCPPNSTNDFVSCISGSIGTPIKESKNIISLHYRKSFKSFSISPSINFDDKSDEFGVDIPVFLFTSSDKQFVGGINLGWTTLDDDFTFGIFVGKAFSFF